MWIEFPNLSLVDRKFVGSWTDCKITDSVVISLYVLNKNAKPESVLLPDASSCQAPTTVYTIPLLKADTETEFPNLSKSPGEVDAVRAETSLVVPSSVLYKYALEPCDVPMDV